MRISDWSSDVCSSDLAGPQSSAAAPPRRSGTFMPGLVLGVLLAVAVAAVTVYTRPYWGPLVEGPGGEAGALAGLESRVAELRAAIPADSSSALSDMSARIATLETEIGRAHAELQSLMRISYAVFCLKTKTTTIQRMHHDKYTKQ